MQVMRGFALFLLCISLDVSAEDIAMNLIENMEEAKKGAFKEKTLREVIAEARKLRHDQIGAFVEKLGNGNDGNPFTKVGEEYTQNTITRSNTFNAVQHLMAAYRLNEYIYSKRLRGVELSRWCQPSVKFNIVKKIKDNSIERGEFHENTIIKMLIDGSYDYLHKLYFHGLNFVRHKGEKIRFKKNDGEISEGVVIALLDDRSNALERDRSKYLSKPVISGVSEGNENGCSKYVIIGGFAESLKQPDSCERSITNKCKKDINALAFGFASVLFYSSLSGGYLNNYGGIMRYYDKVHYVNIDLKRFKAGLGAYSSIDQNFLSFLYLYDDIDVSSFTGGDFAAYDMVMSSHAFRKIGIFE